MDFRGEGDVITNERESLRGPEMENAANRRFSQFCGGGGQELWERGRSGHANVRTISVLCSGIGPLFIHGKDRSTKSINSFEKISTRHILVTI